MKTVAVQYAKDGIRVTSIHPRVITTRMVTEVIDLVLDGGCTISRMFPRFRS